MGGMVSKEGVGCLGARGRWRDVLDEDSMEALAIEAKNDGLLSEFPGRLSANNQTTANVSMHCRKGQKGVNQDSMLAWEGFSCTQDATFCGVFDGHGPYGHVVSRRVRDSLPLILSSFWAANQFGIVDEALKKTIISDNDETELSHKEERLKDPTNPNIDDTTKVDHVMDQQCSIQGPTMFTTLKSSYYQAFQAMDKHLRMHPLIKCFRSGTTAVTIVKQGDHLVIANLGDSRAVMGRYGDDNNSIEAVQLTVDLKPDLPQEEERIKQCNGRVFAMDDEPEVKRVWLPHRDSPGLAMARAFGDFCLKEHGLISIPQVSYKHLTNKDLFVVLATDGVWDVLSNQKVVSIIASASNRATAAKSVVDVATRAWRRNRTGCPMDDCSVVCLYLDG